MQKDSKIFVAGGQTFIGAAILRALEKHSYTNVVGKAEEEPLLIDADQVDTFFARTAPEYVFVVAGKSGGIAANQKYPADLMLDNLLAECHITNSAYRHRVKKLLHLASSCTYPKHCPQPMRVESLLSGPFEPSNEAYAIAKIAGIKLCQAYRQQYDVNFISAIPANIFGPGDDFSREDSHVIAGLIRRMHEAEVSGKKTVKIWGTGSPRRDFIFVDDLADACILVMEKYDETDPINLGSGVGISIGELAVGVKEITGFQGRIQYDKNKPDGMPEKILDCSKLQSIGWYPKVSFQLGLKVTYEWFLQSQYCNPIH